MRSASQQFTLLGQQEARSFLRRADQTGDSHGDRIAAQRRLQPVTTEFERVSSRAYNEFAALERLQKVLRGEWPEHGPIIPSRVEVAHG